MNGQGQIGAGSIHCHTYTPLESTCFHSTPQNISLHKKYLIHVLVNHMISEIQPFILIIPFPSGSAFATISFNSSFGMLKFKLAHTCSRDSAVITPVPPGSRTLKASFTSCFVSQFWSLISSKNSSNSTRSLPVNIIRACREKTCLPGNDSLSD